MEYDKIWLNELEAPEMWKTTLEKAKVKDALDAAVRSMSKKMEERAAADALMYGLGVGAPFTGGVVGATTAAAGYKPLAIDWPRMGVLKKEGIIKMTDCA